MSGRIVAHPHDCGCKGCTEARAREESGEDPRFPPWPPLRPPKKGER